MLIAVAIMDTGFKRYIQIDAGEHKDYTVDVLKLSIADQFENCYRNGMDIVAALFTGDVFTEKLSLVNNWYAKTTYLPKRIESQKRISNTLYDHKKYYLD